MSDGIQIRELSEEDVDRMIGEYIGHMSSLVEVVASGLYNQGLIREIDARQLKEYFSNPDNHQEEIRRLAEYYYISSAEVHQLYVLIESLPSLNYKINSYEKSENHDRYLVSLQKILNKIKHKTLTRDILKQLTTAGTLIGIWLGDNRNPYPYIFDNLDYVYPAYRKNGEWVAQIDLRYFDGLTENEKQIEFNNLSPYVTEQDYANYKRQGEGFRYIELPQDRTFVLHTGTLRRNQRFGTSWVTSGLYDVLHKKRLKDVESAIANKIINALAVLTIGSEKNDKLSNHSLPSRLKKQIHASVKAALEKNSKNGITLIAIPEYSKLEFPDFKTDGLSSEKFEQIDEDIKSAYGLSGALLSGTGSNYASAKLNLDVFYSRIGVLLEKIETEVYGKLFNLVLPKTQEDNFYLVYDKNAPLTTKEKLDVLMRLNDKGWSIKAVIDQLGLNWQEYLDQTLYETEELKLQARILPYQSSYTLSKNDKGRPSNDDTTNDNTIRSKTTNGNDLPE